MSAASSVLSTAPVSATDPDLIGRCWDALVSPGDVHELRIPDTRKGPRRLFGVASGYFDDRAAFVEAASRITGRDAVAAYLTLNPVNPALLARAANRVRDGKPTTTADADVIRRRNLLLDFDPIRPADISSTDAERDEAIRVRRLARACLRDEFGWPDPVMVTMSGNGGGLVYRIDLPNDAESAALVQRVVQGAAVMFRAAGVAVDTTTYNAARITKVIGTVSAKGDHVPERPWRLATGTVNPEPEPVSREHLEAIAAFAPKPKPRASVPSANGQTPERTWDVADVLTKKGIGFAKKDAAYATAYRLDRCPTSDDHTDGAAILEFPSGALAYTCHHNRCQGKSWEDVRGLLDVPRSDSATPNSDSAGADKTDKRASDGFVGAPEDASEAPWPERQPVPPTVLPAPALPPHMIPDPLRPWIQDIAGRACLPLEMVAAPAIVAAGAVVGRRVGIRPGRFDDFLTVPNLWGAVVARPGWMKSNAIKEAFGPVGKLAAEARKRHEEEKEAAEVEVAALTAQLKAIEHRMNEAAKKGGALADLKEEYRAKKAELKEATPTERRYLTHDATVEKLGELLRDNPRGLLLLRDELSGWLRALDKLGREGDREFFLEAWNGTGSFTQDRLGRGTIHIPALTLSIFGGIQPGKLHPLIAGAMEGGAGDDGLIQRLQVLVSPDRLGPWEKPDRWPDAAAKERAHGIYAGLDTLTPSSLGADGDDIPYLTFTPGAQTIHDRWRDELEARLRSGDLDEAPAFAAHIAKYRSLMPSLALVFHLIDVVAGFVRGPVGEAATRLAAAWCEYLECHARKVYAGELAGRESAAHALATKIDKGALIDGQTVREIYRMGWEGLESQERVMDGLTMLGDLGWVRVDTKTTGGRPSQIVRLHPDLRKGATR